MPYKEVIAVYSEIHTKHINTLCGQKAELWNVKLVVQIASAKINVLVFVQLPMTKYTIADYLQFFFS
jgi:hypothetical protein